MTLDLLALSRQIEDLVQPLQAAQRTQVASLQRALAVIEAWRDEPTDALLEKIAATDKRITFQPAKPRERWDIIVPAPPVPERHTVAAADGSQIDRDRHSGLDCILINIGAAVIHYGGKGEAELTSRPLFLCRDEDLYLPQPSNPERREPIAGALLHAKRNVLESAELADLASRLTGPVPLLCLLDNSLILWGIHRFEPYVQDELLQEYGECLDRIYQHGLAGKMLALAGFISRPGSTGVVNLVRLAACDEPDCGNCRGHYPERSARCREIGQVQDRELFAALLKTPGSRSAVFDHPILPNVEYAPVQMSFFYINTGEEIARVEVPDWVAENPGLLEFTHSALWSQSRLGQGYPTTLLEAHEQAVIGGAEREQFWTIVESISQEHRVAYYASMKSQSKRIRAL